MFYEYDYLFLAYICVHCTCACRGQKRVLNLETKSQVPMSCGVGARNWILVSWIGASALNCQAVSPDPKCLKKKFILCMIILSACCLYTTCMPDICRDQKSTSDMLELGHRWLWATHGCWGPNSGPLEEHHMLLPTEPSLQSYVIFF